MIWVREPVTTLFSAFTTTIVSPLRSRLAIRLAARPRTSPVASTTVGVGPAVSGKETHSCSVRLCLQELRDRQGGPAGGVNLGTGLRRVGERRDRERFRERPVGEELPRDHDRLLRLRDPLEVPDVQRVHLVPGPLEPVRDRVPDRCVVRVRRAAQLDDHPVELRILLAKCNWHGRGALDLRGRYKRCPARNRGFARSSTDDGAGALPERSDAY